MIITIDKDIFLENINTASHFTSNKLSSTPTLQGILIKGEEKVIHFYATNLSNYFHTEVTASQTENFKFVIDPKKTAEFISLLSSGNIELEITEKTVIIRQGKTKGSFPITPSDDFPLPPQITEKEQIIDGGFLTKNLPFVLFSASVDDTRPTLTGVNFLTNENLVMVSTDGFRLSLLRTKKDVEMPSAIVPASFLGEILKNIKKEKEIGVVYSPQEKIIRFRVGKSEFFSRLIEGDFPPFERVLPTEKTTTVTLDKDEFLRNIRLISVFSRDFSNVIILDFKKDGLQLRPKMEGGEENVAYQEIAIEGEDQKVAFNHKFVIDFLNHVNTEKITIELLRSNAPVVFRTEKDSDFIHIIMPVRIQD